VKETTNQYYEGGEMYGRVMQKHNIKLLKGYCAENYHGRLVTLNNQEINLILDEKRFGFRDWDAYQAFNFKSHGISVEKISQELWDSFKVSRSILTKAHVSKVLKMVGGNKTEKYLKALNDSFAGLV
jgi:hypothetical protein